MCLHGSTCIEVILQCFFLQFPFHDPLHNPLYSLHTSQNILAHTIHFDIYSIPFLLIRQRQLFLAMRDEHDTKRSFGVVHVCDGERCTVDGDVPLFDYEWEKRGGNGELESIPDRVAVGDFGNDSRCTVYMALYSPALCSALPSPLKVKVMGYLLEPYVHQISYAQPSPSHN